MKIFLLLLFIPLAGCAGKRVSALEAENATLMRMLEDCKADNLKYRKIFKSYRGAISDAEQNPDGGS